MFTFTWPYVLLLLPLIFIVQTVFPGKPAKNDALLRAPLLPQWQTLHQQTTMAPFQNKLQQFYAFSAWSLLLLACANPEWLGDPLPVQQEGRNILLAVDLSTSMAIPDLQRDDQLINRLDSVKTVAASFIDKRQGDKLGLILFGSKAYLQTPLTFDRKTVHSMLDDATVGLAGDRTAIGDALGLATQKLITESAKSRILILLTDGGNNTGLMEPLEAMELAKRNQVKIYTVGIGASQLQIRNGFGSQTINPSIDLDENLLKRIASKTNGLYFRAEDEAALNAILESINKLEPIRSENKTARPITALFYWPLAAALLFFTLLFFPTLNVKLTR